SIQYRLSEHGFWIYDFILPYTILDTIVNKRSDSLYRYLKDRPEKQFTMLDCHDGIPVKPDMDELIDTDEARELVDLCVDRGENLSFVLSEEHQSEDGFNVHQIRCTYYSALNKDDNAYLAARAIQFFVPGIPQVYYVGLLAGENDVENVQKTREGREINRHNYSMAEIEESLEKDVVQRLLKLIRFRNEYAAFNGRFKTHQASGNQVCLSWEKDNSYCKLTIDLNDNNTTITYIDDNGDTKEYIV